MNIQEILRDLAERVAGAATVRTVFGEPIDGHSKTIIPVARTGFGFGGGSGHGICGEQEEDEQEHNEGEGLGAGGGGGVRPLGVFEVTVDDTRFVPVTASKALWVAAMIGLFLGLVLGRRR